MKRLLPVLVLLVLCLGASSFLQAAKTSESALRDEARELAQELILVDTHIDVPYRLNKKMADISMRTAGGDFDYPRAKQGGLNVAFMSIYVPASYQRGGAKLFAEKMIDMVEGFARRWPKKFEVLRSVDEVDAIFAQGKMALAMGMENGAALEGELENLAYFYERGIRYITLTHSKNNDICDSSYDPVRRWNGLSPFGRKVVAEMNRLGMMIDVSHVSDQVFYQVLETTRAPVIASHSSCRHFTPGWERNMSDTMLRQLKDNGGVIQINFGSSFLRDEYRKQRERRQQAIQAFLRAHRLTEQDETAKAFIAQYDQEHPVHPGEVADVADHIDHVVDLIGVEHVGIGSDFDGVDSLPNGLNDVSDYPNLIYELLKRGYTREEIQKICGGNLLRVWSQVGLVARRLQTE